MNLMYPICVLGACAAVLAVYMHREMGASPSPPELARYEKLPYFSEGRFFNLREPLDSQTEQQLGTRAMVSEMSEDAAYHGRGQRLLELISNFVLPMNSRAPKMNLPAVPLSKKSFSEVPEKLAFFWLGHNSAVLEISGKRIGIDLVFGNASPVPFTVRRYQRAPLSREDLPDLDYILITHNHYDHLERSAVTSIKKGHFIVPLGIGAVLRGWGISPDRITELGWGDTFEKEGLKITAAESRHFSGRKFGDGNTSLWCSYIISTADARVFWGCDGGYGAHFAKIGAKYGPFDLCALETDAWNPCWPEVHMFPQQMVRAAEDLRAKNLFPQHWGTYALGFHHWRKSIDMVVQLSKQKKFRLLTPKMGEKCIPGATSTDCWWKDLK